MKPVRRFCRLSRAAERRGSTRPCGRVGAIVHSGATLTEVLMAILIMAVGVVSVFTLFPISVLRTIQATQQTNSKIHKLNVDELVQTSPGVLTAFQAGTSILLPQIPAPPLIPALPPYPLGGLPLVAGALNYRGQWQPQTRYNANDVVVPTLKPSQTFPTPFVLYRAYQESDGNGDTFYTSAIDEPTWSPQTDVIDSELRWFPIMEPTTVGVTDIPLSYVVDPLGYHIAIQDATSPAARFGNKTDAALGTGVTPADESLLRIHGGITSGISIDDAVAVATANVAQPDSWEEVATGTPTSATDTSVTFPPTISLGGAGGAIRRIVLTSADGQMTTYRPISNIAGQTVNLVAVKPVPTSFPRDGGGNPLIGTARIESLNRRFTWFLTVRNSASGDPDIKCVVVFNRNLASASEHVYDANFGDNNDRVDVDNLGGPDATQHGLTSTNWVKIAWRDTEPDPLLKPGNWLLDARDVTWYRIQEVFDQGASGGVNYAVLFLDRGVRKRSLPAPSPVGQAILMPGIVEVFNL